MSDIGTFSIEKWQPCRKGKLYGFVDVRVAGLKIAGIKIFQGKDGPFASMPSTSYTARDGKVRYDLIVQFADKETGKRFSDSLVRRLVSMDPAFFSADGDATVTPITNGRRTDESRNAAQPWSLRKGDRSGRS